MVRQEFWVTMLADNAIRTIALGSAWVGCHTRNSVRTRQARLDARLALLKSTQNLMAGSIIVVIVQAKFPLNSFLSSQSEVDPMKAIGCLLLAWLLIQNHALAGDVSSPPHILIIVGPTTHPPGTHEVAAGGRLLQYSLQNIENLPEVRAEVHYQWPRDQAIWDKADTVVLIGDTFPANRFPDSESNLKQLGNMMDRGGGIVCIHYATGLRAEDVAADGEHPLLHWMGGYFATRCEHHQSIAKVYESATIEAAAPAHPIWNGCQEFTLHDEPYINNYFGPNDNKLAENVTVIATSSLPPEAPRPEAVAWCVDRAADGGRGFGIVMPHFYRNWAIEDLRRLILNGIIWTARRDVPADGVQTNLPDLASFHPESVEPIPRAQKRTAAAKDN